MSKSIRGNLLLMLTAMIWGVSFVAQSVGMDYVEPFTFNVIRLFLAGISLLAVILATRGRGSKAAPASTPAQKRRLLAGGICCGGALFLASSLQQFGVLYTTAGKAGFITALSIVFVPVLGLLLKKPVSRRVWLSVAIAVAGLYLLCIRESFSLSLGDALVALSAFFFAVHVLVIDHFSPHVDGVKMSCIQFFTASALGILPMLMLEAPSLPAVRACLLPLLYAGVLSGGLGYTLQIIAQRDTKPAVVCLILSLESVFAVIAGVLLLHERLTPGEIGGCGLMLAAVILTQLPEKIKRNC